MFILDCNVQLNDKRKEKLKIYSQKYLMVLWKFSYQTIQSLKQKESF